MQQFREQHAAYGARTWMLAPSSFGCVEAVPHG